MDLPAQAMACMISGLEPASMTKAWNPNDGALLAEIVANKVLHAVVKVCLLHAYFLLTTPHSVSGSVDTLLNCSSLFSSSWGPVRAPGHSVPLIDF